MGCIGQNVRYHPDGTASAFENGRWRPVALGGCRSPCCSEPEPHLHVMAPCCTPQARLNPPSLAKLGTWADDARRALTESPDYFLTWYTAKSLGFCIATAALAYYVGKEAARRELRRNRRRRRR